MPPLLHPTTAFHLIVRAGHLKKHFRAIEWSLTFALQVKMISKQNYRNSLSQWEWTLTPHTAHLRYSLSPCFIPFLRLGSMSQLFEHYLAMLGSAGVFQSRLHTTTDVRLGQSVTRVLLAAISHSDKEVGRGCGLLTTFTQNFIEGWSVASAPSFILVITYIVSNLVYLNCPMPF